jgi:tetratricopeptide (TPR) repeat protein
VPPDLLGWIGTLLVDEGEYASGAICLAESCEIAASVDRLILLASAFARSGELGKALEALRKALELDPSNDEAWHNLGAYLSASSSEAEQAFGRALHLNPNRSDSYGGLAIVFIAQGRPVEAIDVAQKGLAKNALDGICHFAIGQGAELLGNMEMAEVAYSRAFRCDYDKPAAILGLGRVLELDGKITHALDWYLRGLRAWPDDARIRDTYLTFAENHKCSDPEVTAMCRRCASNSRHEGDLA